LKSNYTLVFIFTWVSLFIFSSCNVVKFVDDGEYLLKTNTIKVNDKKRIDQDVSKYLIQQPNSLVLGAPVSLYFHNLGSSNYIDNYEIWKDSFPKRENFLSKLMSEKQSRVYRRFRSDANQWFLKSGESPAILDSIKTKQTVKNLTAHFKSQGFFRTKTNYKYIYKAEKQAEVEYQVNTGNGYKLDGITRIIQTPVLDSIYANNTNDSFIQKGNQYRIQDFENESLRITDLFRNSGIYHFNRSDILPFEIDTTKSNYTADIKLKIKNHIIEKNDSTYLEAFKIQKVDKVDIFTDYTYAKKDKPYTVEESYKNYTFHAHEKLKYNSKLLTNSIFIYPDNIYKDEDRDLTRKNIRGLKNFRLVDINYIEENDSLKAIINLTPHKKYSFKYNQEISHSNIRQMGVSGKVSFENRNVFRGAEILELSVQGSFFNSTDVDDSDKNIFFNAWEFGVDLSLEIPRILFPIETNKIIPKYMSPKTEFTLGSSFQKNIGLDKQLFTGIIGYNWQSSQNIKHRFELINSQFIKNLNPESYFDIYTSEYNDLVDVSEIISETTTIPPLYFDENGRLIAIPFIDYVLNSTHNFEATNLVEYSDTENIDKRYKIITEDVLIPAVTYEFIYNNRKNYKDSDFSFFRIRVASSGNLTTAFTKESPVSTKKELAGIPIAQYAKTDIEYKKFWGVSDKNTLAFRSFLGAAFPYGNSTSIPFNRSYFIGGANDLRAWKIYDLGPGSLDNNLEYNVGTLKFLTSLEYRFNLLNSLKGAFFADAGNIWDITNSELIDGGGKFKSLESLKDIAIGTGFGLRYDFSFLVVRLDVGFKTYEPYITDNKKWFRNYNFNDSVFNFGINYPF
jgi:outer membrane protein assembly factor BamA